PRPRPGPRAGYGRRGTTCAGRRPERGVRKTWGTAYPRGGPPFSRNTLPGHLPDERPERGAPRLAAPADVSEDGRMPELPEVAALADFLRERTSGHTVRSVEVGSIAALKTFSPSPDALAGGTVADVARHGKWLDVAVATSEEPLHLVFHLSRGGWVRWSDSLPAKPVRPSLGGSSRGAVLALRVRLDDGSGFDLTEAGTRKRLAVHVVRDPAEIEMVASLGVEPLDPAFTTDVLAELLTRRNQQV